MVADVNAATFVCSWHSKYFPHALPPGYVLVYRRIPGGAEIRFTPKSELNEMLVSHGMCPACDEEMQKEIQDEEWRAKL